MQNWASTFRTPLWLTAVFLALLVLFAITPEPKRAASSGTRTTTESTPGPHECVLCGVGKTCNPDTGRCELMDTSPLPCVEGSKFDKKAGFCLPTGTPRIVNPAPPVQTEVPTFDDSGRQPRQPRRPGDQSGDPSGDPSFDESFDE